MHEPQKPLSRELFESQIPSAQKKAFGIALSIVRSHHDAEEIVQDALVTSFRNVGLIEDGELDRYLSKVTRNGAIDRYRREGFRRDRAIDDMCYMLPAGESTDPEP